MINKVYKLTIKRYERETKNSEWRKYETVTKYVTPNFFEEKTGPEIDWWVDVLGAHMTVRRDGRKTIVENVEPMFLCQRTEEVYEPVSIKGAVCGYRERESLEEAESQMKLKVVEKTEEHTVLAIGSEHVSMLDLNTMKWVG